MRFDADSQLATTIPQLNQSLSEIEEAGEIGTISVRELFDGGSLDRALICKAGGYDKQSLKTIVRTKLWDLRQGQTYEDFGFLPEHRSSDPDIRRRSFCLWAFGRGEGFPSLVRDLTPGSAADGSDSFNPLFTGDESRYVLMPLTGSGNKTGGEFAEDLNPRHVTSSPAGRDGRKQLESLDDFRQRIDVSAARTAKSLSVSGVDREPYPSVLFPEVVETARNAFLVSGLWLTQEWMLSAFRQSALKHFRHILDAGTSEGRVADADIRGVNRIKKIEGEEITEFRETEPARKSEYQRWLVARIEYPYVVRVTPEG